MKKLSELPIDTMLTVSTGETIMTKEYFLDSAEFLDYPRELFPDVTIAEKTFVTFDLPAIIERLGEDETYEDWETDVWNDIGRSMKKKIIDEAVDELNRIFKNNPTYWEGEPVEIDMSPK